MLDTLELEDRGVPTGFVCTERLANTTAIGMARAQGAPDLPIAIVPGQGSLMDVAVHIDIEPLARSVEQILLGKSTEQEDTGS